MRNNIKKVFVGISGASGTVYGIKLIDILIQNDFQVHASITKGGLMNAEHELDEKFKSYDDFFKKHCNKQTIFYDEKNISAAPASGSFRMDYYIFAPASMGFVGRIAAGISMNLLERAADVAIKEKRPMAVLFREMPLSSIHLENLLKLSRLGVSTLPAAPAFYNKPKTIEDMINFTAGKVLDILNIDNKLYNRWK